MLPPIDDAFRHGLARALMPLQAALASASGEPLQLLESALVTVAPENVSPYPSANRNRVEFPGCGGSFAPTIVTDALALYRAANVPRCFAWLSPSTHEAAVAAAFAAHGFTPFKGTGYPTLVRDCTPLPPPATTCTTQVLDAAGLARAQPALTAIFGSPEHAARFARSAGHPGIHHLVALDGDRPVAAALLAIDGTLGYLGDAATAPEMRGRGAHAALIAARIALAASLGCTTVAVETLYLLKPSLRNLQRHGFTLAYDKTVLVWEAEPAPAKRAKSGIKPPRTPRAPAARRR